jgi:aminopeptidase-like protein
MDVLMRRILDDMFDRLFPLSRSITGRGIEESIGILSEQIPFSYHYVSSGTKVFDWVVPKEWNCVTARLEAPDGNVIADIGNSNLHVVNYSVPVDCDIDLEDLEPHIFSLPAIPSAIPYVTSYYKPEWGFCIPHDRKLALTLGKYRALIDSSFTEGRVMLADALLEGDTQDEILITSYICHPSLANNELSGPLVLTGLYQRLREWKRRRYSYRFVINPETIGSLCYLYLNGEHLMKNVISGVVLTCLGGPSENLSYKLSRRGNSSMDRLAIKWNKMGKMNIREFDPCSGSDERQYCSPGFNLPVGQVARTVYATYEGYHNSLDNKEFMTIDSLVSSVDYLEDFLRELDNSGYFVNLSPYGEPQLGKRNIYPNINAASTWNNSGDEIFDARTFLNRTLMILNYSDGHNDMQDIAEKCSCSVNQLKSVADILEDKGLIKFLGGRGEI